MASPDPELAECLRIHGEVCRSFGSEFFGDFYALMAADLDDGGPAADLMAPWIGAGRRKIFHDAAPNRIGNAFTWLAMGDEAPEVTAAFPAPGRPGDPAAAWAAAKAALPRVRPLIDAFMGHEPQTNEVRRSAVLLAGFLVIASETGLPIRAFEVGASAGLNLHWDRFRYHLGDAGWGDRASAVEVPCDWIGPPPPLDARIEVVERAACDRRPTDLADPAQRRRLLANIWPDQFHRLQRSAAAIEVMLASSLKVEAADCVDWTRARVRLQEGAVTVLYHSIFWQYLDDATRAALTQAAGELGAQATPDAPFAWLRMEPLMENLAKTYLTLSLWPGGAERRLAEVHPHGAWVRWLA